MKNKILATLIVISAFIAGYSINSIAISNTTPEYKIAVVDIATILKNSKEINALKLEQEKQMQNMQATIDKAKAEISKEQDPVKIAQLEEKYRNEINKQKLALDTSYNNKLTAIDNKIKTAVVEKARSMNYNMVLPKILYYLEEMTLQNKLQQLLNNKLSRKNINHYRTRTLIMNITPNLICNLFLLYISSILFIYK